MHWLERAGQNPEHVHIRLSVWDLCAITWYCGYAKLCNDIHVHRYYMIVFFSTWYPVRAVPLLHWLDLSGPDKGYQLCIPIRSRYMYVLAVVKCNLCSEILVGIELERVQNCYCNSIGKSKFGNLVQDCHIYMFRCELAEFDLAVAKMNCQI